MRWRHPLNKLTNKARKWHGRSWQIKKLIDLSQLRFSESVRRQRRFLAARRVRPPGRLAQGKANRVVFLLTAFFFLLGINAAANLDTNCMTLTGVLFCVVIIIGFF
jgi:hypothetical protein